MSALADQLKNVKLKKSTQPMKDCSSPKTAGFMNDGDIADYEKQVLEVNTECWIDVLETQTFPTVLCPFHIDEANVFLEIYKRLYLNKDSTVIKTTDWRDHLLEEEKTCLDSLTERLQQVMNTFTRSGSAFVKTSSRSAKDAPMVQDTFKQLYMSELQAYPQDQRVENVRITCLLKAAFNALKVTTSKQVLDMFLRSERIYQDLLLAAVNQKAKYNENFVIRKFVDIDVDMEFRGFVYNYCLTGLSQYNYAIFSDRLYSGKDYYKNLVKEYFDKDVKPKLTSSDFPPNSIIDFAVCENGQKLWVIEVNPFLETTDGALFSWQHERHILEGEEGFVFRITEKPRPGSKTILPQSIRQLLEEVD